MEPKSFSQELQHQIFGSILDRTEMSPYLLLATENYQTALKQAAKMMSNRGFDIIRQWRTAGKRTGKGKKLC